MGTDSTGAVSWEPVVLLDGVCGATELASPVGASAVGAAATLRCGSTAAAVGGAAGAAGSTGIAGVTGVTGGAGTADTTGAVGGAGSAGVVMDGAPLDGCSAKGFAVDFPPCALLGVGAVVAAAAGALAGLATLLLGGALLATGVLLPLSVEEFKLVAGCG